MVLTKAEETLIKKYVNQVVTLKGINDIGQKFEVKGILNGVFNGMFYNNFISISQIFNNVESKNIDSRIYEGRKYNVKAYYDYEDYNFMFIQLLDDKGNLILENSQKKEILKSAKIKSVKQLNSDVEVGCDISIYDPVSEKLKDLIGKPVILDDTIIVNNIKENSHHTGLFCKFFGQDVHGNILCVIIKKNDEVGIDTDYDFHHIIPSTKLKTMLTDGKIVLVEDNKKYDLEDIWEKRKDRREKIKEQNDNAVKEIIKREQEEKEQKVKDEQTKNNNDDWWLER